MRHSEPVSTFSYNSNLTKNINVGNLDWNVSIEDIYELFKFKSTLHLRINCYADFPLKQQIEKTRCHVHIHVFFNSAPVLLNFLMNLASNIACCLLHIDMIFPTHAIFFIFVSMSISRSINYMTYFSLWSSFSLQLIIQSLNLSHTCLFWHFYQNIVELN